MNLVYAHLAEGRDAQQMLELDRALAPTPEAAQETIDKANMEAMQRLQGMMGSNAPPPPRRRG